ETTNLNSTHFGVMADWIDIESNLGDYFQVVDGKDQTSDQKKTDFSRQAILRHDKTLASSGIQVKAGYALTVSNYDSSSFSDGDSAIAFSVSHDLSMADTLNSGLGQAK